MVEISEIVDLLPFLSIAFAAGIIYIKIQNMNDDFKNFKNHLSVIKKGRDTHDKIIKSQQACFSAFINSYSALIIALGKSDAINNVDLISISINLAGEAMDKTISSISGGTGNPMSADEANRLQSYVARAKRNEVFTPEEAQDFYELSDRLSKDRSDDEGAWGILLLAAAIAALYLLAKKS